MAFALLKVKITVTVQDLSKTVIPDLAESQDLPCRPASPELQRGEQAGRESRTQEIPDVGCFAPTREPVPYSMRE